MKKAVTFYTVSLLILLSSFDVTRHQRLMELLCFQNLSGNPFFSPFFRFKQKANANGNLPHMDSNKAYFCAPQTVAINCTTGSGRYTGFRIEPDNIQFTIANRKKMHKMIGIPKEKPSQNGFLEECWQSGFGTKQVAFQLCLTAIV